MDCDNNEHWVAPCPESNAAARCCNSPTDRVDENGNCAGSCGLDIVVNITEIKNEDIPIAISVLPDLIEIQPGDTVDFKVFIRTEWNKTVHNLNLQFCTEYEFEVYPKVIEEVQPFEIVSFDVTMHVPSNATLGSNDFEFTVFSDELRTGLPESSKVNIGQVDYTIYFASLVVVGIIIAAIIIRRFTIHKSQSDGEEKGVDYGNANMELVNFIIEARGSGMNNRDIRKTLTERGWPSADIDDAMKAAV